MAQQSVQVPKEYGRVRSQVANIEKGQRYQKLVRDLHGLVPGWPIRIQIPLKKWEEISERLKKLCNLTEKFLFLRKRKCKYIPLRVDRDGIVNWNKWPINGNSTECPGDGKVHESISLAAVSMETSPNSKNFLAITEVTWGKNVTRGNFDMRITDFW